MSDKDQILLEQCLIIAQGGQPDPEGHWRFVLDNNLNAWQVGRSGSMNRPRLANAIRCYFDPEAGAKWWSRLLTHEEAGHRVTEGGRERNFWHMTYEPMSQIYEGWSLIAEAVALFSFSQMEFSKAGPRPPFGAPEDAERLLRRSIRRHLGLAALCAIPDFVDRDETGKIRYRGLGIASPGARSKPTARRTANRILAEALAMRPPVDPAGRNDLVGQIARALPASTWGLTSGDQSIIMAILGKAEGTTVAAYRYIVEELLPQTKTIVRFQIRRYSDRVVAVMHNNPSGLSGGVFLSEFPTTGTVEAPDVKWLYPYGGLTRVRGKRLLGRGSCAQKPGPKRFEAENMTRAEQAKKGAGALRFDPVSRLLPDEPPLVIIEIGPGGVTMRDLS